MAGERAVGELARKLGIKAGCRVAVLGAPEAFAATLGQLPDGVELSTVTTLSDFDAGKGGVLDVVVWFGTTLAGLRGVVQDAPGVLTPAGGLWIGWPKRASGIATEVDADVAREVARPAGLVDNKICAIDESWSGIRFVLRRELRAAAKR